MTSPFTTIVQLESADTNSPYSNANPLPTVISGVNYAVAPANATYTRTIQQMAGDEYNVLNYCLCNGQTFSNFSTTSGQPTVSTPSYTFTSADIGKYLVISTNAYAGVTGPNVPTICGTITATAAGVATVSANATATLSGTGIGYFGTDDSTAFNNLILLMANNGGGVIYQPDAIMIITNPILWADNISLIGNGFGRSIIKWINPTSAANGMLQGLSRGTTTPYLNLYVSGIELDAESMIQTTYNVRCSCFRFQFMKNMLVEKCYMHGAPATGFGVDYIQGGAVINNIVSNCGRSCNGGNLGGSGIGIGAEASSYADGVLISGNTVSMPTVNYGNYGIFVESEQNQSIASGFRIIGNLVYLYGQSQFGLGSSGVFQTLIADNQVIGNSSNSQRGVSIDLGTVTTLSADPYGMCRGNHIHNVDIGFYYLGTGTGQYTPTPYTFSDNHVYNSLRYAYYIHTGASIVMDGMVIDGGVSWGNGACAIYVDGTAGLKNFTIRNHKAFKNGLTTGTATQQSALTLNAPISGLTMANNEFYDDAGTHQLYGVVIQNAVTNAFLIGNKLSGNVTGALSLSGGSIAGWIEANPGYNPLGATSVTPTASPWTYTAGNTPETLYLAGGTVSSVVSGGITLASATNCNVPLTPGSNVVVTYSTVPTASSLRQ